MECNIEHCKSTKTNLEKGTRKPNESATADVDKDRIEHVISSTKELINTNNSEKVLVELVKGIGHGDKLSVLSAEKGLEEIEKRGKCDWLKTYQNPDQQGETLLHLAIKSQDDTSLVEKLSNMCPDLLFMAKENLTPLQLAAKHGVTELFEEILNLKNVYCYISSNDGLFDVKEYDITEIDTVSVIKSSQSLNTPKSIPQYFDGISKNVVQSNGADCG